MDALSIAARGIEAVDTTAVIEQSVSLTEDGIRIVDQEIPFSDFDRLFVVGVGKCSLDAAYALEAILGERITDGVVVDVRCGVGLFRIKSCEGTHPMPSEGNVTETAKLIEILKHATERDVVLSVVSGGGSTLLCQPESHTCLEEEALLKHMFKQGATIHELNVVRKHLSYARGGWLSYYGHPARVFGLVFSDVPGNDLSTIASGPTVLDRTTCEEAAKVLDKYQADQIGFTAAHLFETPKEDKHFSTTTNYLVATNETALTAMAKEAERLGYQSEVCASCIEGEATVVGKSIAEALHEKTGKQALLYGGETVVRITGDGEGGRNQELALSAAGFLAPGEVLVSLASDGWDNTPHAGAIVDSTTVSRAEALGLSREVFLERNDSYTFFKTLGDGLDIGYTGSNVSDLIVALCNRNDDSA